MPRSRRALLAALGSSVAASVAGCTGDGTGTTTTTRTTTTDTTTTTTTTTTRPGKPRWTLETGTEPGGLVVRDGRVYFGSDAVYALDPDGTERWRYTADNPVRSLVVDGRVYATTGSYASPAGSGFALHALDDGNELWSFARDGVGMLSEPAVGADGVYVATRDDYLQPEGETLYGLSRGGDRRWAADVGDAEVTFASGTLFASYPRYLDAFAPDGTEQWSKKVEDLSPHVLGVHGDTAFAFWESTLRALALADGSERWSKAAAGPTVLAGDALYTVTDDGVAMALDPASGEARWEQSVPSVETVTVADGTMYVLGTTVTALSTTDGSVQWTHEFDRDPLETAVGADVFLTWAGGTLYALDAADGSERWMFTPSANDDVHARRVALGDAMAYVALSDGTLYALRV